MVKPKKDRNLKLIDGKWYVDFTFNKKRIRQFGGYTKEQARNTLAKLRIEKVNEKLGFKKNDEIEGVSFKDLAKKFLEEYSKVNKRSWKRDESSINNLNAFFKSKNVSDITPDLIERYKAGRRERVSVASVNRELACLKTMFSVAIEWKKAPSNPARKIKLLDGENKRERILNDQEIKAYLKAVDDSGSGYLKAFSIIALNTGMRPTEIYSLKWENINIPKRYIFIESRHSKNKKSRKIPINEIVVDLLKEMERKTEYLFFNPTTGTHIKNIRRAFMTACKEVGIEGVVPYTLRHTAATKMISEAGVDVVTVKEILGHSDIKMTIRYCHPSEETLQRAVAKLGKLYEQTRQKVDTKEKAVVVELPLNHLYSYN